MLKFKRCHRGLLILAAGAFVPVVTVPMMSSRERCFLMEQRPSRPLASETRADHPHEEIISALSRFAS
jgi:hypothetical protein